MKRFVTPLLFCLCLVSCSTSNNEYEDTFYGYGQTRIYLKTYQGTDENIQELMGILNTFSKETDNYLACDVNNVYTINNSSSDIAVSENLYVCLKKAKTLTAELDSYFSMYLGSLSKIWKNALSTKILPNNETITTELSKVASTNLTLKENNVVSKSGEGEIDLGAFAKGYALDLSKQYFKEKGISQYLVDAGSSSILLGEKNTDDGLFTIKLKDLSETYIKVKNTCVSTSSIQEQCALIDGSRYTHIVNPKNGIAQTVNDTVIVLSQDGALGDALSTSLMLMSETEIIAIEEDYNVQTIVIRDHKVTHCHQDIQLLH